MADACPAAAVAPPSHPLHPKPVGVADTAWGASALPRRTRPELVRPYRTPAYPVVPIVFLVATLALIGDAIVEHPATTLAGIGVTLLGMPVYLVWRAGGRRLATPLSAPEVPHDH